MGYNALLKMQEKNRAEFHLDETAGIPSLPKTIRSYGRDALLYLRDWCADLKFDNANETRKELKDLDGKSCAPGKIPYNMERDLDRLSFEAAIGRFLATGSREDAFDIYYCYCEIFKPFGTGYDTTGLLLQMLSEHERNASSLLMKHRDHYSHSVYVFLVGLSIYKNHEGFRKVYNEKYHQTDKKKAACHFLEYWGLTALFHDIGYPFEIAHQQMKAYVCRLDSTNNDDNGFAPYVSYKNMDEFALSRLGDLNDFYAYVITEGLSHYLERIGEETYVTQHKLKKLLKDRGIHENPNEKDYLYMDHAYFSGLTLAKTYLARHKEVKSFELFPQEVLDSFCAVILHNSLFKFSLRSVLHTKEPLSLYDGHPLAYLLMLCDELQCWDRTSYGQNSRGGIFAFDFDMTFANDAGMTWTYYFDSAYADKVVNAKAYKDMQDTGYTKKSGAVRNLRSKFLDDIDEIISLKDVLPCFEPDVKLPNPSGVIKALMVEKQKKTGLYLSDSNYLNLYEFALALNGRYCGAESKKEMAEAFENHLSLEYKLSNIAQAKGFAGQLHSISCFYTDRAVDYEPVYEFNDTELMEIARSEHNRWCDEKLAMGWKYGEAHIDKKTGQSDSGMREKTRLHHDLKPFEKLPNLETRKDSEAMKKMLTLIQEFDGLTIYRM